jgi:predicted secreted protein
VGVAVRAVSRHRPVTLAGGTDSGAADREVAAGAAKDASVVYQCVNAPYNAVAGAVPAVAAGVLAAAERTGALQVVVENLRGYGRAESGAGPPREKEKGHGSY